MKEFLKLLSFFLILSQSVYAQNFKIEKILDLKDPWSLTFVNKDEVLITEKDGEIVFANIKSKDVRKVKHNLNYKVDGQGGLLDIIKHNNDIFICYTEDRGGGKTSTSIAKATFTKDNLNFKNIFQANPPINSGYHFGCRLVIK
ncbi:MAG: PQQ-dependent sugar dehydrogenase, partial [Actinobacteria bacterium]|nr:PQQ-dependent sugar dehydrogenase [Actinomycetota bacterium]